MSDLEIHFIYLRINRNIVECKEKVKSYAELTGNGINRNIVECKEEYRDRLVLQEMVLIETLWNVKTGTYILCIDGHVY